MKQSVRPWNFTYELTIAFEPECVCHGADRSPLIDIAHVDANAQAPQSPVQTCANLILRGSRVRKLAVNSPAEILVSPMEAT